MTRKIVPAIILCCLLSVHAVLSKNHIFIAAPADSSATDEEEDYVNARLDLIADSINFVYLDEDLTSTPMLKLVPTTVQGRIAYLQKDVPLTYNEQVQTYIDVYSTERYKRYLSRMMGLGQYYFPIYERVFEETGLPDQIKYLSIVESALNPHAVSRVGATGPWQFMFATARMYDLAMDSYIDERKDPIAASYAASAYLQAAYDQFGDWLMAIAAYNCGTGNVLRAIRRSGLSDPDYWSISPYLPRETRNYVPAFIAMTYMLEYHEEHEIVPEETDMSLDTEMVWVHTSVPFRGIAEALDMEEEAIKTLNPAYKRNVVNGTPESPRRLILPAVPAVAYPALYAVLNNLAVDPNAPVLVNASNSVSGRVETHRVQKGETLEKIAKQYQVTVQDLRVWNNLKRHVIVPGQQLHVAGPQQEKSPRKVTAPNYVTYRVKKGDTLSGIAQKHRGATVSAIRMANALTSNTIKPGMTLKISVK